MSEIAKPHTRLTPDESCAILTGLLRGEGWPQARGEHTATPFYFTKFGDGLLELLYHPEKKHTCDHEWYSPELAFTMRNVARVILESPNTYLGDWFSMTSGPAYYVEEYKHLIGEARPHWLHFEAVLLMRESFPLLDFYSQLKADRRQKAFMGPKAMEPAAKALGAAFICTPTEKLHSACDHLHAELRRAQPELLIWGAGLAGHIPVTLYWIEQKQRVTCVNLGSALDPIYRGKTRAQQLHPLKAQQFLGDIL